MTDEVGRGHFSGEHEGDRPREQTEEQERSPERLEHGREAEQRQEGDAGARLGRRKAGERLGAVRDEEKRHDDPEDALQIRRPPRQNRTIHSSSSGLPRRVAALA